MHETDREAITPEGDSAEDGWDGWGDWERHRAASQARSLAWKRRSLPRWHRWRSLQLRVSHRKRAAVCVQPHPRWRHRDGRDADAAQFRAQLRALGVAVDRAT